MKIKTPTKNNPKVSEQTQNPTHKKNKNQLNKNKKHGLRFMLASYSSQGLHPRWSVVSVPSDTPLWKLAFPFPVSVNCK